ncbi:MAG: alkaline phosphatase family protein [Betaproteobacteria bacterium]|nr:alkaline phosphatase family protein [Betaproteobacteria bacterium]
MKPTAHPRFAAILFALFLASLLSAGCVTTEPGAPPPPKLVVFLVLDGAPQWQVTDFRDQLAPDGLRRFLDRGAWFSNAHYGHSFTVTCAGHAVMLTGAYPHRTGIIGNEWHDRASGQPVYCASDAEYTYLENKTPQLAGTSPRNLQVETVGDVLRRTHPAARVIAISGKDRGAIMLGGKTGTAYMYMSATGQFSTSTYYMKAHPAWVKEFNAAKPAERYFKKSWTPLLPESAYARSVPDEQPWFAPGGKLPKLLGSGDQPGPGFYGSLLPSPFADQLTLDFARAAIAGEGLGQDNVTDILSISLSGHDYINHGWGAESRLSQDHLLWVDRMLEAFFQDLDRSVGRDNYVAVLTADHGFTPAPEYSKTLRRDAGRVNLSQTMAQLNAGLVEKFGAGRWVRFWSASGVMLDDALIAKSGVDRRSLEAEGRRILLGQPGIAAVFTRSDLEGSSLPADTPYLAQVRNTFYRDLSADLEVILKPYWIGGTRGASTHGSPHPYDTNVPIMFWGPGWIGAGQVDARVEVADIASTLARLIGVSAPAASEGTPLPLPAR